MYKHLLLITVVLAGCVSAPQSAPPEVVSGIDTAGFDESVRPQDDFYRYVNGGWLAATEIPPNRSDYGSFSILAEQADARLRTIVEDVAAMPAAPNTEAQKIGDYYRSFMDVDRVNALGAQPLDDELTRVSRIINRRDLARFLGYAQRIDTATPLGFWIGQDSGDTSQYIVNFTQSGLGLPDRDYYLKDDDDSRKLRDDYVAYLDQLFDLAGVDRSAGATRAILEFETEIARAQWSRTKTRDRDLTYNKMTVTDLTALFGKFDTQLFLDSAQIGSEAAYNVRQPDYARAFGSLAVSQPLRVWRDYLRAHLISAAAPYLSTDFVDAHFNFYSRRISGIEQNQPRWQRAIRSADQLMGQMIGKIYVERHFQPEAKTRMDTLVANLLAAFGEAIDGLDWMSIATRDEAHAKLDNFMTKIGYPVEWRDYSTLGIRADDLYGNVQRSINDEFAREVEKLGGPVDRGEWFMSPQTVNAYYYPPMNEVVFPAAILQPPFFNVAADDAVNYGAIGAVIGHEISHGFDDQGRKSDGNGVLRNWWTESDSEEFSRRADILIKQFDKFEPLPGKRINGRLTVGENIGDLSGLAVAFRAYKASLGGRSGPVIDGWTADQRFFIGSSQVWRRKYRDSELRRRLLVDPHSPAAYRVLGILPNIDEFYDAFDVKPGDAMYLEPAARVKIW